MDDNTEKKAVGMLEFSKTSSGLSFRNPKQDDTSSRFHARIGCSTWQNSTKSTKNSNSEKLERSKTPLPFKSRNHYAASSSRSFSLSSNFNKYCNQRQSQASIEVANMAESSERQGRDEDVLKSDLRLLRRTEEEADVKSSILPSSSTRSTESSSNANSVSASRFGKQISRSFGSAIQDITIPSFRQSSGSRFVRQLPKATIPECASGRPQRHSPRNLGCASVSDAHPSGSSYDKRNKRAVSVRKKIHDGESSSSGMSLLEEQQVPEDTLRSLRNPYSSRDAAASVRTCWSLGRESSRMKLNEQENEHIVRRTEPNLFLTRPHAPLSISEFVPERSLLPFARRPQPSSGSSRSRSAPHLEDRDAYHTRFNMEGIAEVMQALEMIEQDEELTYEQLMVLEANMLLEGFSFYDQHRDMRLDIDNMSYEDLLALEEKMGSVSTALPEEALLKCLKKRTCRISPHMPRMSQHGDGDIECSICQEEYVIGEEVGKLPCKHRYHVACIHQWLRLKNWCPICKAPVVPS